MGRFSWSGKTELVHHLHDAGALSLGKALYWQRQAPVLHPTEVLGDRGGHTQTAPKLGKQTPQGFEPLRFCRSLAVAALLRGVGDCEGKPGQCAADYRVPSIAAGFRPVAATASPETPIVTCSGTIERIAATCSVASFGSVGTPGILIDAIPGSSAMRA